MLYNKKRYVIISQEDTDLQKNRKKIKNTNAGGGVNALPLLIALGAVVLAFLAQYIWFPQGIGLSREDSGAAVEIAPVGAIRINEAMSSNKTAWTDDQGNFSDWVELINASNEPVDITGWTLTDSVDKLVSFTFPQQVLQPGEIVLVYASDDLQNVAGYAYHAPFKLSSQGDAVMLFDAGGNVMESVNLPALRANQSYARNPQSGDWETTPYYTPGLPNTQESYEGLNSDAVSAQSDLRINEIMADNASYVKDEDGEFCDWIEILNTGSAAINLEGYTLSDSLDNPRKWRFPAVSIDPGQCLIVYASGKDRAPVDGGNLHANFKLNAEGEDVTLSDANGRLIDKLSFSLLKTDQSLSRKQDGSTTTSAAPTPGRENTSQSAALLNAQLLAANPVGLVINEASASARRPNASNPVSDWLELYNGSGQTLNLEGYGLSDDPSQPRKWQFPAGASIGPGEYLQVTLSGSNKYSIKNKAYHTNFKLSLEGGETLTLSTPEGQIIDRMPMMGQYAGISYGRIDGQDGFFYLETPTAGKHNDSAAYAGRAGEVHFSVAGGWYETGSVTLELFVVNGEGEIHYTTDCSEPTENSPLYTAPLALSENTIVRAKSFDGNLLSSPTATQSYFFGERAHTLPVISLVTDPTYLFDEKIGIYVMGEKQLKYPYKGANFWKDWERAAHVEYFDTDGTTVLSQGAGLALQGQYSRMEKQKAFKVTARTVYGSNSFDAALFPNRDYTEYKSFILRASGQDNDKTRYRDALLTSLAEDTSVMYQDVVPVAVYLNGEYWGHYNMRERIHKYSIAQWEGWQDVDAIDIVKANDNVLQGSNESFEQLLTWLRKNGCTTEENLAYVAERVDIDNYLDYVAIQMFIGNTDLLNVKRYRSDEGDGRWRWILFDTDWAFYTDTDSYRRWLDPAGAGSGKKTNNTLFVQLMKNKSIKEKFLTRLGELMGSSWTPEIILEKSRQWQEVLLPEMPAQAAKWGPTQSQWKTGIKKFEDYAKTRSKKMLTYIKKETGLSTEQMRVYFGEIMDILGM